MPIQCYSWRACHLEGIPFWQTTLLWSRSPQNRHIGLRKILFFLLLPHFFSRSSSRLKSEVQPATLSQPSKVSHRPNSMDQIRSKKAEYDQRRENFDCVKVQRPRENKSSPHVCERHNLEVDEDIQYHPCYNMAVTYALVENLCELPSPKLGGIVDSNWTLRMNIIQASESDQSREWQERFFLIHLVEAHHRTRMTNNPPYEFQT
ncbi:hypothetical protein KSP39_PZI004148 [Platanthera zijinensis]|uniref:Uncharacterized protein n=1 Tax=Platanthera zijinensis TaxID=2320716 RepID=A0AAP0BUS8_9ASPA